MAKYDDVFEDVGRMFIEAFAATDLERYGLRLRTISVGPTQKEVIKPAKAGDLVKYLNNIDIILFINETVFDKLEEVSQRILIEEAMARISYDTEKEKLSIEKGDVHTPSLFLQKIKLDPYLAVQANISQVLEKMKEEAKK